MRAATPTLPADVAGSDARFVVEPTAPGYVRAHEEGWLRERVEAALDLLTPCRVCPRPCLDVDRRADEVGACRIGRHAVVASAFPHHGEEDVLRGWRGSGTIFMAGCNLRCVFCQNADISQRRVGTEVDAAGLAALMLELQARGCHNINIVTPEHVVPQMLEALPIAVEGGLSIPLVYNTSAYDAPAGIALLDGIVDVYMPDIKLFDAARCHRFLGVRDYGEVARAVVTAMHEQVGDLAVDADGIARRGLLVRHLVMPEMADESAAIVEFVASLSTDTYLNVMDQYRPDWRVVSTDRYPEIDRPISRSEVEAVVTCARASGLWRLDRRWRRGGA